MLTKEDIRALFAGIIPDGLDVSRLTEKAKQEKREALDALLRRAKR